MLTYLSFANYLSVLPLVYIGFSSTYYIITLVSKSIPVIFTEKYLLGYLTSIFLAQLLKYILYPFFDFAKRPQGACGCDYNSQEGDLSGRPGFPSGHMSTTAYFVVYNLLILKNTNYIRYSFNRYLFTFSNLLLLALMGWARYYKKCHTLIQIVSGTILGSYLAIFFYST